MKILERALLSIVLLNLSACSSKEVVNNESDFSTCPIIESRNWQAEIVGSVNNDSYTLNVSGIVDLPTPNYKIDSSLGITDRAFPPNQRINLSITPASQDMAIQVVTPRDIELTYKIPFNKLNSLILFCGGREIATINEVVLLGANNTP